MTSTTEAGSSSDSTLIKTDKLGRLRTSPQRREMLLDEFEQSGMSGSEFAALIGVGYSTFAGWRQRRNKRRQFKPDSPKPLQLVEAVIAERSAGVDQHYGLFVHLPGGVRLEVCDVAQVPLASALLKSLQASGSPC